MAEQASIDLCSYRNSGGQNIPDQTATKVVSSLHCGMARSCRSLNGGPLLYLTYCSQKSLLQPKELTDVSAAGLPAASHIALSRICKKKPGTKPGVSLLKANRFLNLRSGS